MQKQKDYQLNNYRPRFK